MERADKKRTEQKSGVTQCRSAYVRCFLEEEFLQAETQAQGRRRGRDSIKEKTAGKLLVKLRGENGKI